MPVRHWPLVAALVFIPVVSWAWIVVMAHDMYGPMSGASAWMMTPVWDVPHLLLLWSMWAVMMTGMMLPSAAPMILLTRGTTQPYFLASGYLAVWTAFSLGATGVQWLLGRMLILTPMMIVSNRWFAAALLAVAGLYQWTPLKRACLTTCQSPMSFLMRRWRSGPAGAFRMGAEHGVYCVGCCWALMLLLFAGGVMNLVVVAGLTLFIAFEKLVPLGRWAERASGAALIVLAGLAASRR